MKNVTPVNLEELARKYPISKEDKDRFLAIKENANRLGNCKQHFFPELPKEWHVRSKVLCPHCQGYMDLVNVHTYVAGFIAAGGTPTDIVPEWYDAFDPDNKMVAGDGFKGTGDEQATTGE